MPANFRPGSGVDGLGDLHHRRRRRHAAASRATVDLHQALDLGPVLLRRRGQVRHVGDIIDAADRARTQFGHPGQAVDLLRVADLVRHQHVLDAAAGEDLRLAHLLAADAAGAAKFDLQLRHVHRLVHLAVHAVPHPVGLGVIAHLADVALQRVEVEHEAGGLDVGLVHAGLGRDVEADFELVEIGHVFHVVAPLLGRRIEIRTSPGSRFHRRSGLTPPSTAACRDRHCRR